MKQTGLIHSRIDRRRTAARAQTRTRHLAHQTQTRLSSQGSQGTRHSPSLPAEYLRYVLLWYYARANPVRRALNGNSSYQGSSTHVPSSATLLHGFMLAACLSLP